MPGRRFSTLEPFQGRSVLESHPRLSRPSFARGEPPLDEAPPAASTRRRGRVLTTRWANLERGPCKRNVWGSSLILPPVGGFCPQCLAVSPSGFHHEQNPAARRPGSLSCQPSARRPSVSAGGASPASSWRTVCLPTPQSSRRCGHVLVRANVSAPGGTKFVARLRPGDNWRKSALHSTAGRRARRRRCWALTAGVSRRVWRPESY